MLRGGRDVVCSIKTSNYLATMKPIKKDFTIAVDTWVNGNLEGYKYWDHPGVKVVKYEDLISRPQETLEGCVEFLEEDYTDSMLEYHVESKKWFGVGELVKPKQIDNLQDHKKLRN